MNMHIGFLHPGEMGVSLAATAQNTGHMVYWVSEARSPKTYERAAKNSLNETRNLKQLCERCGVIISVCPPHAAMDVAQQVLNYSWKGIYADVNAIAPQHVQEIGQLMQDAGVAFVDGGIIGGPAWEPDSTWLYLSGKAAEQIAACFEGGPLETEVIGEEIGKASALKMCYAANIKGTTALLSAIVAAADKLGVREELQKQWSRDDSEFVDSTLARIRRSTAKAWRFVGEMEEIALTFEAAELPSGFHMAAADIYQRIAKFKGADPIPSLEHVLDALLKQNIKPK